MTRCSIRLICFILLIFQLSNVNFAQTKPESTSESGQDEPRVLEKGISVERDFRRGQVHAYKVPLTAGQYLKVYVRQREVDVYATLIGPDEKRIFGMNNSEFGTEQVSVLADTSGSYKIQIGSLVPCRPRDKSECNGQYEIKIAELRESTPEDSVRFKAQQLFYTHNAPQRTVEEKIEKLKEIRQLYKSVGEVSLEAATLYAIASNYIGLQEPTKGIEYYEEAIQLWKSAGDHNIAAEALFRLGLTYSSLGEIEKTLDCYEQSLSIHRKHGYKRAESKMLYFTALNYLRAGYYQKALYFQNQNLTLRRAMNYPQYGELMQIGYTFEALGEKQKARESFLNALAELQSVPEQSDDASLLGTLYTTFSRLKDYRKSAEYGDKLIQFHRNRKDRFNEARWLSETSKSYTSLGEYRKALEYLNQALTIHRTIDNSEYYLFTGLELIGNKHAALGDHQIALDYYKQAYSINKVLSHFKELKAPLTHKIAGAHRELGNLDEALLSAEEMISTVEYQRTIIVNPELRKAFSARMHEYYKFYIDLLMLLHKRNPSSDYAAKALQASEKFRARSLLESLGEARVNIRQGVDAKLLERERELRQRLSVAAERQNRLSTTKHTEEQAATVKKEVETATAEYEDVQAQIRRVSPRYAALTQPQPVTLQAMQRELLDADTVLLEYSLGEERSYLWVVTSTSLDSYELPKREAIEADARRVYELLSDGKGWTKSNDIKTQYAEAAGRLSETLLSQAAGKLKGKRLIIIADGALQYIPFGALPAPQELQKTNTNQQQREIEPLAVGHEIISLPSASTLNVLRRETANRARASKSVAVFADPVFTGNDERMAMVKAKSPKSSPQPETNSSSSRRVLERAFNSNPDSNEPLAITRLPFTRREAEGIFLTAPPRSSLKALDFEASRDGVLKSDLSAYRIVHFATHGLLNSENPELSGIVLSLVNENGQPVDGFLRLNEIYNLNLSADLVVLSACQTALGKEVRGEGLVGLTRGFMYAGSSRVVASLWKVDDVATAELMKLFYRKMLQEKMRPAAALRAAKIEMWKQKRWNAPFYWAAFELQGEWR